MSRAVLRWRASGSPDALRKTVEVMPSWRALAVIIAAKRSSVPPRNSATAVATSLADLVAKARIAVSTGRDCPALRPSLEGGRLAA
jgi:hypothetical protein